MPSDEGLCHVFLFKSTSRPPLEHVTFAPVENDSDPDLDLESVYCSCEGFAYNKKCWHVDWVVDELADTDDD